MLKSKIFVRYKKYRYDLLFIFGFIVLSAIFYSGFTELSELPKGMHQWKQSMHFSMIQNYIDGTAEFWNPAMNNLFNSNNSEEIILEFPLFHKLTALIINLFPGLTPTIFRWLMLILTFIGFYHAYKLANLLLKNELLSILASFLTFVLPVVVFYSANYLVDVPAMAFGFSAIYFFEKNSQKCSVLSNLLGVFFLTISGLLRLPVLILPLSYIGARIIYRKKLIQLLWLIPSGVIIFAWYYYVKEYNTYYVSYPPSETYSYLSPERLSNTMHSILNFTVYQLGWTYRYLYFYLAVFSYLLIFWKKVSRFWFTVLLISMVGSFIYIFLWFGIFEHHDYYMFPIIPVIFLIWLNVFIVAINTVHLKYILYLAIFVLVFNAINTFDNMRLRTYRKNLKIAHALTGRYESGIWWYFGQEDSEKWSAFRHISPYAGSKLLQEYRITPNDTVICDFDPSPTYSLAILNLKGWTQYNCSFSTIDDYKKYSKLGAKYLITNGSKNLTDSFSSNLLKSNFIFKIDSIEVYNIAHLRLAD